MRHTLEPDLDTLLASLGGYLDRTPERMRTLEPGHYTSEAFFECEVERIWKKEWINVGHVAEVRKPGDFFTVELLGEPMMIVRGKDMEIRTLSTVCRHRYMLVVEPGASGSTSRFQCPYHRWTYGLDGQLQHALHMEKSIDFDPNSICLPQFRTEIWNNLVWVNLDDDAAPLAPKVEALDKAFAAYRVPKDWVIANPYDKIWPGNWKNFNENNMEGYHHMGLHEETLETYTPTRGTTNITYGEGWTHYQTPYDLDCPTAQALLEDADWKSGDLGQEMPCLDIFMIHPANAFVIYPGGAGFYALWPVGVDKLRYRAGSARPPGELRRLDPDGEPYDSYRVLDEDGKAMPFIAQGVRSAKAAPGHMSWMEEPILRWYQWIARRMLGPADSGREDGGLENG